MMMIMMMMIMMIMMMMMIIIIIIIMTTVSVALMPPIRTHRTFCTTARTSADLNYSATEA